MSTVAFYVTLFDSLAIELVSVVLFAISAKFTPLLSSSSSHCSALEGGCWPPLPFLSLVLPLFGLCSLRMEGGVWDPHYSLGLLLWEN